MIARIDRGPCPRTANADDSALRRFCGEAMGQPENVEVLQFRMVPDRLQRSIPEADVEILIERINDVRYRTATLTDYGAGLRISGVVALHVGDIWGMDGRLQFRSGKGDHERMSRLPDPVLQALGQFGRNTWPRPGTWLIYGDSPDGPISVCSQRTAFKRGPRPSCARPQQHLPLTASRGCNPCV